MTKEEAAYVATLNLLGTGEPGPELERILTRERICAACAVRGYVRCPQCPGTVPYDGPMDGAHFADLWEHLIAVHHTQPWLTATAVQGAWEHPVIITLEVPA